MSAQISASGRSTQQPMCRQTVAAVIALLLASSSLPCEAKSKLSKWFRGTATYYGDDNGHGTENGNCGYGNNYLYGYGLMTAAASPALWFDAKICGACFEVMCVNTAGCKKGSVVVTATNLCPGGDFCGRPRKHLDLTLPVFKTIAEQVIGHMSIRLRRVPCVKSGNAKVTVTGNPWFMMVLFTNLAGSGDSKVVQIRQSGTRPWKAFRRNFGAVWSLDTPDPSVYYGRQVDFRIRAAYTGELLVLKRALPAGWAFGGTYETSSNFGMTWK